MLPLIKASVMTPEEVVFQGEVSVVQVPALSGVMQVMYGHEPYVSLLGQGTVILFLQDGKQKNIMVGGGVLELDGQSCKIMVDIAVDRAAYKEADISAIIAKLHQEILETEDEGIQELLAQRLKFYDLLLVSKH